MGRRYPPPNAVHGRGGRMLPYIPPPMMGGPPMRNNNGLRRSGGGGGGNNSPPQSLLGGYRPPGGGNFRGRGGPMNNPAYMHNMANMINLLQQQQLQQQQKPGSHKYANPNNPNNRFYQQFQDNYKKISSGQKISNLYQASFPVQHIPREMRFNFRLLGRNIFTASDEEEEEKQKQQQQQQQQQQSGSSEKRPKQRRETSSESESQSDDDRRKRRDADDDDEDDEKTTTSKSKSKPSPTGKNSSEQKRSSAKNNRNRTASTNATSHSKNIPAQQEMLNNSTNLSTLLAGIMQSDNPEVLANSLVNAAVAVNSKRERNKKQQEKKVQKFKNYARFQQIQASAAGVTPQTNPDEVEKKIHGLARRLVRRDAFRWKKRSKEDTLFSIFDPLFSKWKPSVCMTTTNLKVSNDPMNRVSIRILANDVIAPLAQVRSVRRIKKEAVMRVIIRSANVSWRKERNEPLKR